MSRELWLLRHAKAERNDQVDDFNRALKKRGKQAAAKIGQWLSAQQLAPDWVISSPAKRAINTAVRVLKIIDEMDDVTIVKDQRLYFEGLETIKTVLAECPTNVKYVMLVGHNPDLEDLLVYLVGLDNLTKRDKLLPTASLVRLIMPDNWQQLAENSALLLSITDAKSL